MKLLTLICMSAGTLLIVLPATAQEYLPPAALVEQALSSHPDVRAKSSRLAAAESEARRLESGPYEWALNGSGLQRSIRGLGDYNEFDLGLSRGFRLPGKFEIDQRIGAYGIDAARNAAEDGRHQAALQLMDGWMTWLRATESVSIAQEQVVAYEAELAATEKRLASDDAADVEVELVRAALAETRATAVRATGELSHARASLEAWFPELVLPASPPEISEPADIESLVGLRERVLTNSHEIGYVDAQARRAEAVAERARADRSPDPQIGFRAFSERDGEETGLGITFSIPIGGRTREAAAAEQAALASAARLDSVRVRRAVEEIAETDYIQAQSEFTAWRSSQEALADSKRAIERLRSGFGIGATSLQELLVAERRHLGVRMLEAESRTRAAIAALKLRIDAHELWLAD